MRTSRSLRFVLPTLVFLLTFSAFLPALQNGFVSWDDNVNFLENPYYRGLSWNNLRWMFMTIYLSNYRPLTWVTFGFDYLLWGMNPSGYHLTSLLLHAVNALLYYFLAMRLLSLTRPMPAASNGVGVRVAAGFAAVLFSIHPLRVEPVVWLSARNHLLATLFFLSTIVCYLRAAVEVRSQWRRWRWLAVAVILYALSLLSQLTGITLPFVLLALDIYPLRRLGSGPGKWLGAEARRVWWEKAPFLLLALGGGLVAKYRVVLSSERFGALGMAHAMYELAFFGWKTLLPLELSPLYQLPFRSDPWDWPFVISGLVVLAVSAGLFVARHRWPAALTSWVCYLAIGIPYVVVFIPVIGSVENGSQVTADRYTYLSCLPWALLAGAGLQVWLRERIGVGTFTLAAAPVLALVVMLMGLTWKQTQVWHDSETLLRQVLSVDPRSSVACNNLGNVLLQRGEFAEAIDLYRKALEIDPAYADAYFDLATAYSRTGQLQEAAEQYLAGLRLEPNNAKARYYLGLVYARWGDIGKAVDEFRQSLNLSPAQSVVHVDLGVALAMQGDLGGAADHFRQAIAIRPDSAEAHHSLGRVLAAQGRLPDAVEEFREAVRLNPDFAEAQLSLSQALAEQGKQEEAAQHYQEARRILESQR